MIGTGPDSGDCRVLRGGSWFYKPFITRCAIRSWRAPDDPGFLTGFRVVWTQCGEEPQPSKQEKAQQRAGAGDKAKGPPKALAVDLESGVKPEMALIPAARFLISLPPSRIGGSSLRPERRVAVFASRSRRCGLGSSGGTKQSERAVALALNWLARHQNYDGHWSLSDYVNRCTDVSCTGPGCHRTDAGATALALLPFLAAGQTHETKGPYQQNVFNGLFWLIKNQKPDGDLTGGCSQRMYTQGLATICLCEAYGMSRDRALAEAAQRAVNFIQSAQNATTGGWRYEPGDPGDTSVVGLQVTALKSAQLANLNVSPAVLEGAKKWLDSCASGESKGNFSYQPGGANSDTMTAVGVLCRQYLGAHRDDGCIREGKGFLMAHSADMAQRNLYYWYYATQVMHNLPGPDWDAWNRKMRKMLIDSQCREGCATGSWDPDKPARDMWGVQGGRIMDTSLAALTLEVYYRHAPLFKLDNEGALPGTGMPAPEEWRVPRVGDRPVDFLHILQEKGYGDVAIDYLNWMKESGTMPVELADVFDLEMANSLCTAAKQAYDEKEAARLTAEAQKYFDKFAREKADHPAAASAMVSWGMSLMDRALRQLQEAETAPEAEKESRHNEARNGFREAQARFAQAVEKLAARIIATPAAMRTARPGEKEVGPDLCESLVHVWLSARLRVALADYYIAKSYTDVNSQVRRDGLRKAEKTCDDIFQHNRESATGINRMGLYAHAWDGRCWENLGEIDRAKDIYDEVLGDMPDPNATGTTLAKLKEQLADIAGMEPLLTQVAYYRLMLEKKNRVEFIKLARDWLSTYGNITLAGARRTTARDKGQVITVFKNTDGYQGVALELAKMELAVAADPGVKKKLQDQLIADALKELQEASKVPSSYQQEIVKMYGEAMGQVGRGDGL